MKIIIKETGKMHVLSLKDSSGTEYIIDFIGVASDSHFRFDHSRGGYICDQEVYEWWQKVVEENQKTENKIHEAMDTYGSDVVYKLLEELGSVELEDRASEINSALQRLVIGGNL